jgi:hypothetical protein
MEKIWFFIYLFFFEIGIPGTLLGHRHFNFRITLNTMAWRVSVRDLPGCQPLSSWLEVGQALCEMALNSLFPIDK